MNGTVLIVEDDPLLRAGASDLLEMNGAVFEAVPSAAAAIDFLNDNARTTTTLITDVTMPGLMDGVALAHAVLERWPHIRVLITSGSNAPSRSDYPVGVTFIPKPWGATDILSAWHAQ